MKPQSKKLLGYIKILLKNPLTIWILYIITKIRYESIFKDLQLGYLCSIKKVSFNRFNSVGEYSRIKNSTINSYSFIAQNSVINNSTIGSYCSIGQNVKVGLSKHKTDYYSTSPFLFKLDDPYFDEEPSNTVIGNNVWIGNNVIIIGGIKIGDGAIIAAGSVVLNDVQPYSVIAGIPAVLKKHRFNQIIIDKLLKVEWQNRNLNELYKELKGIES